MLRYQPVYDEVRTIRDCTNDMVRRFNRMKMALTEARELIIRLNLDKGVTYEAMSAGIPLSDEADRILDLIRAAL